MKVRAQGSAVVLFAAARHHPGHAWQSFLLPDRQGQARLVLTYGYRSDTARAATFDPASALQDLSALYPVVCDSKFGDYGPEQTGVNRNVGVVARPLPWLSVFYNQSTSFDLNVGRYDPFGNEYAGGAGKDYGLRFDLWQDKITLRINKYETALGPQRAINQINDPARDVLANYYENDLLAQSFAFIQAVDGRATDAARPARANLITNYRFSEGRLRGLNFGVHVLNKR